MKNIEKLCALITIILSYPVGFIILDNNIAEDYKLIGRIIMFIPMFFIGTVVVVSLAMLIWISVACFISIIYMAYCLIFKDNTER